MTLLGCVASYYWYLQSIFNLGTPTRRAEPCPHAFNPDAVEQWSRAQVQTQCATTYFLTRILQSLLIKDITTLHTLWID